MARPIPITGPIHSVPERIDLLDIINRELERFTCNTLREPNVIVVNELDYGMFLRENAFPYYTKCDEPLKYGNYRIVRSRDVKRGEIIVA
jgi:hypothetical protein